MRFARILFAMALIAMAGSAFAQSSIINSGAVTPGHPPMYVQGGVGSQVVATDSGPAGGGNVGLGLSELLAVARGTGTAPYVAQGSGPLGTNICDYDAPITNSTGYHYLCFSANAQGGALIATGAGGSASSQPLCFIVNGAPVCIGGSSGTNVATYTPPTTVGDFPCWASTLGLLSDCTLNAATLVGNPASSSAKAASFTIQGLPARGAPDANNDKIVLYNNSTGALNFVTPALIASSATAGVSSLGGVTGAITLGTGLQMSGQQLQNTGVTGPGGSSGQIQYNNSGALGGFTMSGDVAVNTGTGAATIQSGAVTSSKIAANGVANSNIAPGSANTMKGSLNGSSTSDIALTACTLAYQITKWVAGTGWQCGINPVLPSRAIAATLNLSAFNAVKTLGYAAAGDGGGATFQNVGSTAFLDSQVTAGTLSAGGSSYTSGTYPAVTMTGGNGHGLQATVVVSGGAVTSVTIVGNGGNGYKVGDVLSASAASIGGTGSGFSWTVSAVSTATCSFTDSASDNFQMVVDDGNVINIRQCGAVMNWTVTAGDAGSTNDTTAIQNTLNFAANTVQPTVDGGGVAGQAVLIPFGNTLSGALTVPYGVKFTGQNPWSSQIKFLDSLGSSVIPVTLCDPTTHLSCFGTQLANMTLRGGSGTANSNVPMVFTNNVQQNVFMWRVTMYPQQRGCLQYDHGYGGAAQANIAEVECTVSSTGNPGFNYTNVGTTEFLLMNVNAEFGGSGVSANGFQATGGFFHIINFHSEGVSTAIFWNNTGGTSAGFLKIEDASGGSNCTNLVSKQSGSTANDVYVSNLAPNGCTNTVNNGGTPTTTPIGAWTLF